MEKPPVVPRVLAPVRVEPSELVDSRVPNVVDPPVVVVNPPLFPVLVPLVDVAVPAPEQAMHF